MDKQQYKIDEDILVATINHIRSIPTGGNAFNLVEGLIKKLSTLEKVEIEKEGQESDGNIK